MMKKLMRRLHYGEVKVARRLRFGQKGFTLIELLVVIAILGVLAAVAIPNIAKFMGSGEQEAKDTELSNVQTAVIALLADAGVSELDAAYSDVDTQEEVEAVKATVNEEEFTLDDYILGTPYPLSQAYDIAKNGAVSVSAD